jgi:hypothetical protein
MRSMGQSISICRYWCSTKLDGELEHIGGQGNWGFCRQSCPPITPVTTTTRRPRPTTRSSTLRPRLDTGHFYQTKFQILITNLTSVFRENFEFMVQTFYFCDLRDSIIFIKHQRLSKTVFKSQKQLNLGLLIFKYALKNYTMDRIFLNYCPLFNQDLRYIRK